jgi:hypothetical protein
VKIIYLDENAEGEETDLFSLFFLLLLIIIITLVNINSG